VRRGDLALAPRGFYTGKAAFTRARSLAWRVRPRGRGGAAAPGVRILFYHRVADEPDELAVAPGRFAAQMGRLAQDGLRAVDVETCAAAARRPEAQPVVGLCFDDGYADVAATAPVLERHGFSATVFLPTAVIDGTARLSWYERQPAMLTWEQVAALDRAGTLRFGAHTVTHPNLLELDEAAARREIAGSKAALEGRLGHAVATFCYPAGLFGARERRLVAEAGFRVATSCEPGTNDAATDPLALRRVQVDRRDAMLDFRAKVAGGHDAPSRLRAVYRRLRFGVFESASS
jgi:peptidoglycan/xylan/chitin deacetylase (PgdA/CDA1 family)